MNRIRNQSYSDDESPIQRINRLSFCHERRNVRTKIRGSLRMHDDECEFQSSSSTKIRKFAEKGTTIFNRAGFVIRERDKIHIMDIWKQNGITKLSFQVLAHCILVPIAISFVYIRNNPVPDHQNQNDGIRNLLVNPWWPGQP